MKTIVRWAAALVVMAGVATTWGVSPASAAGPPPLGELQVGLMPVPTTRKGDLPDFELHAGVAVDEKLVPRVGSCAGRPPYPGQIMYSIAVSVDNHGRIPTPGGVLVQVRDTDGLGWHAAKPIEGIGGYEIRPDGSGIGHFASTRIDVAYPAGAEWAPRAFRVTVDPTNTVREIDEGNNSDLVDVSLLNPRGCGLRQVPD